MELVYMGRLSDGRSVWRTETNDGPCLGASAEKPWAWSDCSWYGLGAETAQLWMSELVP